MMFRKSWLCILWALVLVIGCHSREQATAGAHQYAKDLGYEVLGVSCTDIDTDNDGYVGCTLRVKGSDGEEQLNVQCAAAYTLNSGCKVALPKLTTTVHNHP